MLPLVFLLGTAQATTLDEAWQAALSDGEEAVIIAEQRRQAGFARVQAIGAMTPRLSFGANYTINQREVELNFADSLPPELLELMGDIEFGEPTVVQRKAYFDANMTISQPIIDARAFAGFGAARTALEAGEAQADSGIADLRLNIARAYWGALVAQENVTIARDGLEVARKNESRANVLVDAGEALPQAAIQGAMAVARAERDLAAAEARHATALSTLAALVPGTLGSLTEPTALTTSGLPSPEASLDVALKQRPDLRAAELQASSARQQATVSKLGWVPTLDFRFTEAWSENVGFIGEPFNWQIGIGARWTLWDGGMRHVDNLRSDSQAVIATKSADRLREQVKVDLDTAWGELTRATKALQAAERELSLAEENLRLTQATFDAGSSTFLDLEDARLQRDAARVRLLGERMNVHLGVLGVQKAVGGL